MKNSNNIILPKKFQVIKGSNSKKTNDLKGGIILVLISITIVAIMRILFPTLNWK